jgi:hypothetical protein
MAARRLALGIAVIVTATLGAGSAASARGPSIVPARVGVPVFVGSGFTPRALVTVTLSTGRLKMTRRVRANLSGGFLARFVYASVDPCRGALLVLAVDERGIGTRWKQQCRPPSTADPYPTT